VAVLQDSHARIVDEVVFIRHPRGHHVVMAERSVQWRPGRVLARVIRRRRTGRRSGHAAEGSGALKKVPAVERAR